MKRSGARPGGSAPSSQEQGVEAGDVVLIFMPNRVEWQVAMLAALRLGAVPANLPIRTDEDTLRYAAELCGARALLTVDRHVRTDTGELALAAASRCAPPPALMVVSGDGGRRWTRTGPGTAAREPARTPTRNPNANPGPATRRPQTTSTISC